MKLILHIFIIFTFLLLSSAQTIATSSSPAPETTSIQGEDAKSVEAQQVITQVMEKTTPDSIKAPEQKPSTAPKDVIEEEGEEEVVKIADPIYPWNKAMYHFNDKFYFWILKPATKGYSSVVPEDIRLAVSNFFYNLTTPIRFVSNLFQLKMKNAGNELVRFVYNSTVGVCGLADAAKIDFNITRHDEDLGQTLGSYGIGHGFYIVWPFLGPSSLRDTVGKIGDGFMNPVYYLNPAEASVGVTAYDKVNETSFNIGDYEDLKKSAIDPYISIRDAYAQHRKKKVEE